MIPLLAILNLIQEKANKFLTTMYVPLQNHMYVCVCVCMYVLTL